MSERALKRRTSSWCGVGVDDGDWPEAIARARTWSFRKQMKVMQSDATDFVDDALAHPGKNPAFESPREMIGSRLRDELWKHRP